MNFNKVWSFLRKLPMAKFLKPVWKYALKEAVEIGGNEVQQEIVKIYKARSPRWMELVSDKILYLPRKFRSILDSVPLPQAWEDKATSAVDVAIQGLQQRLRLTVDLGEPAINAAFDKFQEDVKQRIDQL